MFPAIKEPLPNTSPFCVPNKIPSGITGGTVVTTIVPEVTELIPVELAVKFAEPAPIPVIFTVHDGTAVDKLQLLGVTEMTELLLLVIATTADSVADGFIILIVAVVDSSRRMADSANGEICSSSVPGGVGVGEEELLPPAEQAPKVINNKMGNDARDNILIRLEKYVKAILIIQEV